MNYEPVSRQDWERKFVTFRLVSAISRNETGITSRYLEITLSFSLVVTRGINGGYLYGRAETRNFSSSVEKRSTGERYFELLHMKCMMGSSRNAWSFCARRAAHLPTICHHFVSCQVSCTADFSDIQPFLHLACEQAFGRAKN